MTRLRARIGARLRVDGRDWVLHDVLTREARLVLRATASDHRALQADQHGDPRRLAPVLREEPVYAGDRGSNEPAEIAARILAQPALTSGG
ncbi:hypothetical protein [Algiphilus sp.]|uniref:hypothetical protein n=1 Tax=Algiphilus sp. TaxID=1872431 RepID=UPI0025BC55AA|nr:hypothetical protein [Algiphilus sp.]MCK5771852.1 hypothetical protein [Algiphilus sp.]